jgi:hypothetical protein
LRKDAQSEEPVGPVTADLNGDGKLDLATADGSVVSVLVGHGDGTFRAPVDYRTSIEPPWDSSGVTGIAAADVNGDGWPDLLVTGNGPRHFEVVVLVNDGAGLFRRELVCVVGSPAGDESAVAAGDVNADGIVDVVVAGIDGDFALLLGRGGGNLAPPRAVPGRGGRDIALADFNADGKLDVALAAYGRRQARLRLGNGDGTFGPAQRIGATPENESEGVAVADLNHDGKLDLAVGLSDADRLVVHFGNGDGTFGSQSVYSSGGAPEIADFNGDGNLDIAQFPGYEVTVRSGDGDGTFGSRKRPLRFRINAVYAAGGTVADLNGDARPDLVSLAYNDWAGGVSGEPVGTEVLLNWTGLPAPPCVVIPVTHRRLRAAKRELRSAGCRIGHVRYRYAQTVRKNRVISQRPRYGTVLPSHARVDLLVSRGRLR